MLFVALEDCDTAPLTRLRQGRKARRREGASIRRGDRIHLHSTLLLRPKGSQVSWIETPWRQPL
jgi:hypothetical protein